jgi:hypothetical protein
MLLLVSGKLKQGKHYSLEIRNTHLALIILEILAPFLVVGSFLVAASIAGVSQAGNAQSYEKCGRRKR